MLEQPSYAEALALCKKLAGKGLSKQIYALRHKIAVVAPIVATNDNIIEVHPEVSFCALRGAPLETRKATWAGQMQRGELLEAAGISLPSEVGEAGTRAAPDDVLDAAIVVWSAHRHALGKSKHFEPVTKDQTGRVVTIWY